MVEHLPARLKVHAPVTWGEKVRAKTSLVGDLPSMLKAPSLMPSTP